MYIKKIPVTNVKIYHDKTQFSKRNHYYITWFIFGEPILSISNDHKNSNKNTKITIFQVNKYLY